MNPTRTTKFRCSSFELASQLFALLDSFDADDHEAVAVHLSKLSSNRQANIWAQKKAQVH